MAKRQQGCENRKEGLWHFRRLSFHLAGFDGDCYRDWKNSYTQVPTTELGLTLVLAGPVRAWGALVRLCVRSREGGSVRARGAGAGRTRVDHLLEPSSIDASLPDPNLDQVALTSTNVAIGGIMGLAFLLTVLIVIWRFARSAQPFANI